jgi:tetratricopeptide (TPR) repeat protein
VGEGLASTDESSDASTGALALQIARAMEQRGDLDGAVEAYRFAFSLLHSDDRSAGEAVLGQGRVADWLGDLGQARDAFRRATEVAPDDATIAGPAWLGLAGVAERQGDLSEARDAFRRATEVARENPTVAGGAWLGLAGIAERQGDLSQARIAYQKVIENAGPEQASLVWLSMERLHEVLERMGYAPGTGTDQALGPAAAIPSQSRYAMHDATRLYLSALQLNELARWYFRGDEEQTHALMREFSSTQGLWARHRALEAAPQRRAWFAFLFPRDDASAQVTLKLAANKVLRSHKTFGAADLPWIFDRQALGEDQAAIAEDFTAAIIRLLIVEHPNVLTTVLPVLIARQGLFDAQSAAKMQGVIYLDKEALSRLAEDLVRRNESQTTDDSSSGDDDGV